MKQQRYFAWAALLLLLLAIGGMATPNAHVMHWGTPGPDEILTTTHSYFDPLAFGYADAAPILSVIFSFVAAGLLLAEIVRKKPFRAVPYMLIFASIASGLAIWMSYSITLASVVISCALVASFILHRISRRAAE